MSIGREIIVNKYSVSRMLKEYIENFIFRSLKNSKNSKLDNMSEKSETFLQKQKNRFTRRDF